LRPDAVPAPEGSERRDPTTGPRGVGRGGRTPLPLGGPVPGRRGGRYRQRIGRRVLRRRFLDRQDRPVRAGGRGRLRAAAGVRGPRARRGTTGHAPPAGGPPSRGGPASPAPPPAQHTPPGPGAVPELAAHAASTGRGLGGLRRGDGPAAGGLGPRGHDLLRRASERGSRRAGGRGPVRPARVVANRLSVGGRLPRARAVRPPRRGGGRAERRPVLLA